MREKESEGKRRQRHVGLIGPRDSLDIPEKHVRKPVQRQVFGFDEENGQEKKDQIRD